MSTLRPFVKFIGYYAKYGTTYMKLTKASVLPLFPSIQTLYKLDTNCPSSYPSIEKIQQGMGRYTGYP